MKLWVAAIAMVSVAGFVRANDLDDNYGLLKEAQNKKDADAVLRLAPATTKLARAEAAQPQPSDASAVADWKKRVEFAKEVETFSEYALATAAVASSDPAKTIALSDALLDLNAKSQYVSVCASAYLAALAKRGTKEEIQGAEKIIKGTPNNEDALYAVAAGSQNAAYATRLVNVMKSKAKPEGISEADWERKKSMMLGQGYYIAGAAACAAKTPTWTDCDRNLRAAIPYVGKEPALAGPVYFYLGLANYQLARVTNDRARMQEAQKFSEQSAAIPGPMQGQARTNANAMRQELATPVRR